MLHIDTITCQSKYIYQSLSKRYPYKLTFHLCCKIIKQNIMSLPYYVKQV